ncbi:hypothetical protein Q3G72_005702 [Acer saccharum]|nr:hypothetical protein Q3G72_005702 [Acer saccharum]
MIPYTNPNSICVEPLMELTNKPKKPAGSYFLFSKMARGFVGGEARHQQLHHCCSDELSEEEKQVWNVKASEAMEAYKKELEEYKNSIAAAIDDNQQL